jgi:hypothetical protein
LPICDILKPLFDKYIIFDYHLSLVVPELSFLRLPFQNQCIYQIKV